MTINNKTILSGISDAPLNNFVPTKLFASNFAAGTTKDNFAGKTSGSAPSNAWDTISGIDNSTGFTWPGQSANMPNAMPGTPLNINWSTVLLINNYATTMGTVSDYGTATIQDTTGPDGTTEKELALNLKDTGLINNGSNVGFGGQMWLLLNRISTGTVIPASDINDIYVGYHFKHPASMGSTLPNSGRMIISDFKSGGDAGLYGGDFRILTAIEKDASGNLMWRAMADRGGNTTKTVAPDGIKPFDATSGNFLYWRETNKVLPVTFNVWHKYELYIHRHATKGLALWAIDDQVICAHQGRTLGEYGNQWGRFMPFGIYTSAGPGSGSIVRPEIWDFPKNGSVLQDFARKMLAW